MKEFGTICYAVCMVSIAVCLVLALVMIWGEVTEEYMWKAMHTAISCFLASAIAFALNREFMKQPSEKPQDNQK
jgi:hypothetical protein